MAYARGNPKSKKELKAWVAEGREIEIYNPSGMFPVNDNGVEYLEGPHYPKPHRWYAQVIVKDGVVVSVK